MRADQKKEKPQFLNHPLVLASLTIACLLIVFSLQNSKKQAEVSKKSIEELERSVQILELEKQKKEKEVQNGQSSLAIEKITRNELLQKKEGEIVLQIPERESIIKDNDRKEEKSGPLEEWKKLLR